MVNYSTSAAAPTQAPSQDPPGGIEAPSQGLLSELWDEYTKDAATCVAAATRPVLDDPEPIGWDATGIDHLGLRRIVRAVHQSSAGIVETIWIKNYPGLRASIPARGLTRRYGFKEGDRRISDDDLCRQFTLTIHGRGHGMRERGLTLVRELCEARCLGTGFFERKDGANTAPARFTPAERAAVTRNKLSGTQWRILEYLAFARGRMGKLGLWGQSANWGRIFGVDERTIRRAMVGLEFLSLAWRHYTPSEGTAGRRVDQAPNMILPGPAWLRVDAMWTGDDDQSAVREHWADVARMRNCERRERDQHGRKCRRARAAGEPLPVPRGGYPLEFEEWARERIAADATLQGVKDRLDLLDVRCSDVPADDAQSITAGQRSPLEAYEQGQESRNAAREALAGERRQTMTPTTPEALARSSESLEALRTVSDSELHQVARRAKAANAERALYSRKGADNLAAPSQAKSFGQRGSGADAARSPAAALVADLRQSLASRFGAVVKPRDWSSTSDRQRRSTERVPKGHTPRAPVGACSPGEHASSAVPGHQVRTGRVGLPNAIKEGVQGERRADRPPVALPARGRSEGIASDSVNFGPKSEAIASDRLSATRVSVHLEGSATRVSVHLDGIPPTANDFGPKLDGIPSEANDFGPKVDGFPYVDTTSASVLGREAAKDGNAFAAHFFLGLHSGPANNPDKK